MGLEFGPPYRPQLAPLGGLGAQFRNVGSRKWALFLGFGAPVRSKQNMKVLENTKII